MSHRRRNFPPVTYEELGSAWNEKFGNALPVLALNYTLDFIVSYMDRMASYDCWYVIGVELDEVPVAHSLLGFSTAFDMIYNDLDTQRRQLYTEKLRNITKLMYDLWWGRTYVQNHVATNVVSILTASLTLQMHVAEAE